MFDLLIPLTVFQRLGVTHRARLLESPKEDLKKRLWVNTLSNAKARRGPRMGQRYAKVSHWPVANVGQHPGHLACRRAACVNKERRVVSTCCTWLRARMMVQMDTALRELTVQQISYMFCVTALPVLAVRGEL